MIAEIKAYLAWKKILNSVGGRITMLNWKTTICGIIASLGIFLPVVGIDVPPKVAESFTAIGTFLLGLLAKDFNVTGGSVFKK